MASVERIPKSSGRQHPSSAIASPSLGQTPKADRATADWPAHRTNAAMNMLSQGPLTDDGIKEIDQFLLDAEGIEESTDISTLDGFLTAIVCGPKAIMPSQ